MADDNALSSAMTPPDPLFSKAVSMYEQMEQVPAVKQPEERAKAGEAGLQDIYGQEKAAQQKRMGIQQEMLGTAQDYQQKLANVPDLGSQASYFRQSTPLLMLMTAVGGIMGRGGSIAALKAMNGMLEGQMQGNQAKYDMAKKAHDDAIAKIQQEYDTKTAVQQMMLKATEGQIDSFRLAEEASQRAIGADERMAETARKGISTLYKDFLTIHARETTAKTARATAASGANLLRATIALEKAESNMPRVEAAHNAATAATKLLPRILKKAEKAGIAPEALQGWLTATSDDKDVQSFNALMATAKPVLAALETAGTGARSNMLLQTMIGNSVPSIYKQSAQQINVLTQDIQKLLDASVKQKRASVERLRRLVERFGGEGGEPISVEPIDLGLPDDADQPSQPTKPETESDLPLRKKIKGKDATLMKDGAGNRAYVADGQVLEVVK